MNRLSALAVSRAVKHGRYPDGGGLYLQVSASGARSWLLRYMIDGRAREMGLGSLNHVSLAAARQLAQDANRSRAQGSDPIAIKAAALAARRAERAKAVTFKDATAAYLRNHAIGWRNAKHAAQWESTLAAYAYPIFGKLPVNEIEASLVLKVLEPIWTTKTETASRLRGRIEAVLDWCTARGQRKGENPARWRGHLESLLPARSKVRRVQHHPALPYNACGAFVTTLRAEQGLAARALELLILTATRTGEAIGARWEEVDLKAKVWTIPADRIKAGREHRVPLSAPALAIFASLLPAREALPDGSGSPWVFPGIRDQCLSTGAILSLLKRMGRRDITAHGFRSTFRDWAAEQTAFPREVAEMSLAHAIGDKVEAAYRRGDLFEKRRRLMDAWAGYLGANRPNSAEVVSLQGRQGVSAA